MGDDEVKVSERGASRQHRAADLALEMLADENAFLLERIGSLGTDAESYRALALEAVSSLARITSQLDAARREILRLRADRRRSFSVNEPEQRAA